MKDLVSQFQNPSPAFRGKPFWSWNGRLDKKEILRQAKVLKEMGFGGYFMHSRVGLETEYLGDEWFELINAGADESLKLGVEAWLYDEDRWPSGSAGGLAAENPELRLQGVRMLTPKSLEWDDAVLGAFAAKLKGIEATGVRAIPRGEKPKLAKGESLVVFRQETMPPLSFYNDRGYIDTTNPDAAREFLRVTHEQYLAKTGGRLGKSIKGVFIDEPHRGMISSIASPFPDPESVMPWGRNFAASFKKRFGYDIRERLPEVFLRVEGQRISQAKWHYVEHLQQMFLDHFMKPVFDWCDAHKLVLTGHLLHEDSLTCETIFNGSMMRNYEFLHAPGVDMLWEGNRSYWGVKKVTSVARQFGRGPILSELYGCTGWQFDFKAHKAVGDWQALFGITLRCPHLSWFTMKGEAKRDYPASILHQSAWWKEYKAVEDYFSRIHVFMSQGQPATRLLVVNPVETVWSQIHKNWVTWLYPRSAELQKVEQDYTNVFHWLAGNQIDFDYGDEDHIGRLGRVEKQKDGPVFRIGDCAYSTILVAGMETIRASTLRQLRAFIKAGGKVVFAGEAPGHVDALPSAAAHEVADGAFCCALKESMLVATCLTLLGEPLVRIRYAENGRAVNDVFSQARVDGKNVLVHAINTDWDNAREKVSVLIKGRGVVEEWNARTGTNVLAESIQRDGFVEIVTDFPPAGERLFRLVPKADPQLEKAVRWREVERVSINGPYEFSLGEPNVCVLDRARWRVNDGKWNPATEILRIDKALREQLGIRQRGGDMVQPWFAKKHLPPPKALANLALEFDFEVHELPSGGVDLVIESPEHFTLHLNGQPVTKKGSGERWVDICFHRFPIASLLKPGRNTLTVAAAFHDGVDLEALYLLGDFGVRLDGLIPVLGSLPVKLEAGCVTKQALPFYGAEIDYHIQIPKLPVDGRRVMLQIPRFEGACAVVVKGKSRRVIAFPPFETDVTDFAKAGELVDVRIVLTRRNTFGPLHQLPVKAAAYHPGSFRTEDKAWSDSCVLYPAGLLGPIELSVQQPQSDFGEEKA